MVNRVAASAIVARVLGHCVVAELDDTVATVAKEVLLTRVALVNSAADAAPSSAALQTTPAAPTSSTDAGAGPSADAPPEWGSAAHFRQERERAARVNQLAHDVSSELRSTGMRVRPFSVMVDKIEYVLLGDYPLKWSDEHMRMRM